MTLAEVLPEMRRWSREDRMELIRAAAAVDAIAPTAEEELLRKYFKPGAFYELVSPITCEGGSDLLKLLEPK